MVINTGLHQAFNKKNGNGMQTREKRKSCNEVRKWFKIKWKLSVYVSVLLASIFVFSGIILYLNMGPTNHCRKGFLNVHIMPYMYSNIDSYVPPNDENFRNDSHIFDFLISELENDERRRFILSETYPLWEWWRNQTDSVKNTVQRLIREGRLDIAGGGWFIPDEASVLYSSFIDQFTWGLRRLAEIAGRQVAPDVSFLMDNSGHSKEIAYLLNNMDFRALMLGGVSQHEQCYRRTYKKMEFLWSDGEVFGTKNEKPNMFASILDSRALKIGSLFEYEYPVIDINEFYNNVMCLANGYSTNNVFIPVGAHFTYNNIKNTFRVVESIMNLTRYQPKSKLNVIYSTPSYYINSVQKSNERWWRSFEEFLPFSESKFNSWTGYYSSRPCLKFLERLTNRFLKVLKQMVSNLNFGADYSLNLQNLIHAVSLSQHYKSVMGVANENTADYMNKLLYNSFSNAAQDANQALNKFAAKNDDLHTLNYESCLRLNISECKTSEESESFILTIYNPSSRYINEYVRIPVTRNAYLVRTADGTSLKTQMVRIPKQILSIPGRKSEAEKELIFKAKRIPALGFKSFYITTTDAVNKTEYVPEKNISLMINNKTGKIEGIIRNNEKYPMSQEILFYPSWLSGNSVFRPENRPRVITYDANIQLLNDGEFVTEYVQNFGSWASQIIKIYKDEDFIEFKWIVGPLPISFVDGKEVITSFATNIKNDNSFYVDVNGRGLERKQKGPVLENESIGEYIARNYRPVNTQIALIDGEYRLHVFNDRVQGGTSSLEGELQLMIHRRLSGINLFAGNDEELNEKAYHTGLVSTGQHWVFIGSVKDLNLKRSIKNFAARIHWEPWQFYANASHIPYQYWANNYRTEYSGISKELPKNLRILTLEPWGEGKILLRLENIGEDGCDRVHLNLQKMFSRFIINKATRVTLAGNYFKSLLTSETKFKSNPFVSEDAKNKLTNFEVFIYPSEIKTFILDVKPLR